MWIHERFVFLHLQKTAGSFVAKMLRQELPVDSLRRGAAGKLHPGWDDIPVEASDRPVLLYVRNPWDWYVSHYHFTLGRRPDNDLFRVVLANGENDFATALRIVLDGGKDPYTARFFEFAGRGLDSNRLTIGRYETLLDDLERFLTTAKVALPDGAMARIRAAPPVNASSHRRAYREYYDQELRDLVGASCRPLIERFDYSF